MGGHCTAASVCSSVRCSQRSSSRSLSGGKTVDALSPASCSCPGSDAEGSGWGKGQCCLRKIRLSQTFPADCLPVSPAQGHLLSAAREIANSSSPAGTWLLQGTEVVREKGDGRYTGTLWCRPHTRSSECRMLSGTSPSPQCTSSLSEVSSVSV